MRGYGSPVGGALVMMASVALGGCSRAGAADERPQGAALYASACARCHGAAGGGGVATSTGAAPRNFRDHTFQAARSDADLKKVITSGTPNGMPPFGAAFDDAQLASLVAVVRGFDTPGPAASGGERR